MSADPQQAAIDLDGRRIVFGSRSDADVVVAGPEVAAHHAVVVGEQIEALAECVVGDVPLRAGRTRRLLPDTSVVIGESRFVVEVGAEAIDTRALAFKALASGAVTMPTIVVVEADGNEDRGKRLALAAERVLTVGRSDACDLSLVDPSVSRVHLSVQESRGNILVCDEGATGGVFLGSARLTPGLQAKWPKDRMVRVGHVVLGLLLPMGWEETRTTAAPEEAAPSAPVLSSRGASVPSLRIAPSAREANIAAIELAAAPTPSTSRPSASRWVVPVALGGVIAIALAVLVYLVLT